MIPIRVHAVQEVTGVNWRSNLREVTSFPSLWPVYEWYSLDKLLIICDKEELELVRHLFVASFSVPS